MQFEKSSISPSSEIEEQVIKTSTSGEATIKSVDKIKTCGDETTTNDDDIIVNNDEIIIRNDEMKR
jgi:hypothetical protein